MTFKFNKIMLAVVASLTTTGTAFIMLINAAVWGAITHQQMAFGIAEFMWAIATGGALTALIGVMTYEPKTNKEETEETEELLKIEI